MEPAIRKIRRRASAAYLLQQIKLEVSRQASVALHAHKYTRISSLPEPNIMISSCTFVGNDFVMLFYASSSNHYIHDSGLS